MLDLTGLGRLLDVDRDSGLVKVESGIGLRQMNDAIWGHGLALENLGDIDRQTISGAVSTGTHGTGSRFRNISSQIHGMEVVLGDGTLLELSEESDPEGIRAARVGLGALGIIASLTLRTVPAFSVRRLDSPLPLDEVLERIDDLADGSDHFEFYVFPHTRTALMRQSERTDEPPDPKSPVSRFATEIVAENWVMGGIARLGRASPGRIPGLARFVSRRLGRSTKLDRSYRVYASQRRIRFTEMEYAIPRRHAAEAVPRVLEAAERDEAGVGFPIEVRFVAGDDSMLSPAHDRDTTYIAVHQYRGMAWEAYFRAVEEVMDAYGGSPALGQAPLPDRREPGRALPALGRLRGGPSKAGPRGPLPQRVHRPRAPADGWRWNLGQQLAVACRLSAAPRTPRAAAGGRSSSPGRGRSWSPRSSSSCSAVSTPSAVAVSFSPWARPMIAATPTESSRERPRPAMNERSILIAFRRGRRWIALNEVRATPKSSISNRTPRASRSGSALSASPRRSKHRPLGHLEAERVGRQLGVGDRLGDLVGEARLGKPPLGEVDRDHERRVFGQPAPPARGLVAGLPQHEVVDGDDQLAVLGDEHELGRLEQAALRVLPAHQRLGSGHEAGGEVDLGLVVHRRARRSASPRRSSFSSPPRSGMALSHPALEHRVAGRACGLRAVHGQVGPAQHLLGVHRAAVSRLHSDPDAGGLMDFAFADPERLRKRLDHALGDQPGIGLIGVVAQHRELVARPAAPACRPRGAGSPAAAPPPPAPRRRRSGRRSR